MAILDVERRGAAAGEEPSGGMDPATAGSVVGVVHHRTAGWYLCGDVPVSNPLLGWRNCSLNSSVTALVGEDTQRVEAPSKALQVTSAETNPGLGSLSLKHPQEYFGRNESDEPQPASNHPHVSPEQQRHPVMDSPIPLGKNGFLLSTLFALVMYIKLLWEKLTESCNDGKYY